MVPDYPEIDISGWEYADQEPVGKNSKDWYRDPGDGALWLFKPVGDGPNLTADGKDWAEKLAHEVAKLIEVPTAPVEFAVRGDEIGTICRNANPTVIPMRSGAILLREANPEFDPRDRDARGHSLDAIQRSLELVGAPVEMQDTKLSAFDVFGGYLVLDAIIGNRDRHSLNWTIGFDAQLQARLIASFDHGSSLGFNLVDEKREAILTYPDQFNAFLNRGTAYRFEGGRRTTLVDMAAEALRMAGDSTVLFWRERLDALTDEAVDRVVDSTRRMSSVGISLTSSLIKATTRRMTDALD